MSQKSAMWRLKKWIIHHFFIGFLSHFSSHPSHFYDVTELIFETLSNVTYNCFRAKFSYLLADEPSNETETDNCTSIPRVCPSICNLLVYSFTFKVWFICSSVDISNIYLSFYLSIYPSYLFYIFLIQFFL